MGSNDNTNDANATKPDPVNPAHYRGDRVMQIIEQHGLGFCLGNVVKYVLRHEAKGGIEDLRKARWYLDRYIRFGVSSNPGHRYDETDVQRQSRSAMAITEEFGLGFCLSSVINYILLRGGTEVTSLTNAMRFLDRYILVATSGVAPPPGPMLGLGFTKIDEQGHAIDPDESRRRPVDE